MCSQPLKTSGNVAGFGLLRLIICGQLCCAHFPEDSTAQNHDNYFACPDVWVDASTFGTAGIAKFTSNENWLFRVNHAIKLIESLQLKLEFGNPEDKKRQNIERELERITESDMD